MVGATRLLAALQHAAARTRADGASLLAHASSRQVFRFAHEAIHQDLRQERIEVTIKVLAGGRVGVASTDSLQLPALTRCARAALAIAEHSPKPERPPTLPARTRIRFADDYVAATARATPAACAAMLKHLFRLCQGAGADLAGSVTTGEDEFAVVNSQGVACYAASTIAGAKLVTMYRASRGYASGAARDLARLDVEGLLQRSLRQSLKREEPVSVPLGAHAVILEPDAVADLLEWLGYIAFGAKQLQERTSFLAGRLGDQVMDRRITIYDNGTERGMLRLPFDFEGVRRTRVALVERGRAAGVVYDTDYGARFDRPSTGHAMAPDEVEGPLPMHLALAPGTTSAAEMVRRCRKGLWIPRFHYVNGLLNPREALMTGLTREGACLIEHGRLAAPVRTLRFTQGLLEAFRHVVAVSRERRLVADPGTGLGCALVPSVHLAAFTFTGHSQTEA